MKIAGFSGASMQHSTRGPWSADGALQTTRKPPLEAPLAQNFQGAGSKGIKLRRRHVARRGEIGRAGIGVFSEVTGACLGLENIISCLLFVARSVNAMHGDSAAFILRELTGIRLRRRFASLEMG